MRNPVGSHVFVGKGLVGGKRRNTEEIGEGHIDGDAFLELFAHPATEGVPFVAETPGSGRRGAPCLPLLKKLQDR